MTSHEEIQKMTKDELINMFRSISTALGAKAEALDEREMAVTASSYEHVRWHAVACKEALQQIEDKGYRQALAIHNKTVITLGVNFDRTTRDISECAGAVYDQSGEKVHDLQIDIA